jgi:D-alanyl-D-alanine carboxypeptidase
MQISLTQRIQLGLVFIVIRVLWVIDDIGSIVRRFILNVFRISLYLIIVTVTLTGFYVKSQNLAFYNIPSILNPESSAVLGAVEGKTPRLIKEVSFPEITAVSLYAVDVESETVLVDINSDFELAPASTTKLMTALVALDLYDLDGTLIVPKFCTEIEGLKAGFHAKDSYVIESLLYSLLVNSSADAACTLAIGKIPYSDFIQEMNNKARELGLTDTSFTNPVGLDGVDGSHHTTAKDLYLLAKTAMKNDLIRRIVSTKKVEVVSVSGFTTYLVNTNDLLWSLPGTVGVKTGQTEAAGEILVYEYDLNEKNIMIVVMHSSDRFGDTTKVLHWILSSYSWPV